MDDVIYLDAAATSPLAPEALDAMLAILAGPPGNPSAVHNAGRAAAGAINVARERVGRLLEVRPPAVTFTGSATEANNLVLRGLETTEGRDEIVTSVAEHDSILETVRALAATGRVVRLVGIDGSGEINLDELRSVVSARTALVSIQAANNETGVVQPVEQATAIAHGVGALVHSDASQLLMWGDASLVKNVDFVTVSSHKMHGPLGVSALVSAGAARGRLSGQVTGGGQERGLRSGTPNVAAIVGFGVAAALATESGREYAAKVAALRERLIDGLRSAIPGVLEHGRSAHRRLPGILNVAVGVDDPASGEAEALLARLPRLAASTGSACHAGAPGPSPVLLAMGLSEQHASRSLRLSLSRYTTRAEVDGAISLLGAGYRELSALISGRSREMEGSAWR